MTDKKDGQSTFAEWAAVITACAGIMAACAGVMTALGFQTLVPDLVRHYFIAPSSQSSSLEQEQIVPPSAQDSLPPPNFATVSAEPRTSPVDVVLSLRQGMDYAEARNKLLGSGWMLVEDALSGAESAGNVFVSSQITMPSGDLFPEISCQGTGLGLCFGKFQLEDGRSLQVTVAGQLSDHYTLLSLESSFYIEPSKSTIAILFDS